jgi:hypothetical protein
MDLLGDYGEHHMNTSLKIGALAVVATVLGAGLPTCAQAAVAMVVQSDTVLSGPCTLSSQFKHGDRIVFRGRVIDTASGNPLDDKGLKSLVVQLPDGTTLDAKYGGHPPDQVAGYYWTAAWTVPADYPTGTLGYKMVATNNDGETATYVPFEVPASQLTIVADK